MNKWIPKELRQLTDELLNKIGQVDLKDYPDLAINGGLAYLGLTELPDVLPDAVRALWGPIGLKLATSEVGESSVTGSIIGLEIPMNSQVAGLSMLAMLGFACLPWEELASALRKDVIDTREGLQSLGEALSRYGSVMTQEEKNEIQRLRLNIATATLGTRGGLGTRDMIADAVNKALTYINSMITTWESRKN